MVEKHYLEPGTVASLEETYHQLSEDTCTATNDMEITTIDKIAGTTYA